MDAESAEQEFTDADAVSFGWDGYHVEDAVGFARLFKSQRDEARDALATLTARAEAAERERAWVRDHCRVVFYPPDNAYPIEHTMHARKDQWDALMHAAALAARPTGAGGETP